MAPGITGGVCTRGEAMEADAGARGMLGENAGEASVGVVGVRNREDVSAAGILIGGSFGMARWIRSGPNDALRGCGAGGAGGCACDTGDGAPCCINCACTDSGTSGWGIWRTGLRCRPILRSGSCRCVAAIGAWTTFGEYPGP